MRSKLGIAANWLPPVPDQIGVWSGTAASLPDYQHAILARPSYLLREYRDPYGNRVSALVVSSTSRHTFHDPRDCGLGSGFQLTGTQRIALGGKGEFARGMVFRKRGARVIMFYWTQAPGGKAFAPSLGANGLLAPIRSTLTIWKATATGRPLCMVRVYAVVRDSDLDAQETLANVREIAVAVQRAIRDGR